MNYNWEKRNIERKKLKKEILKPKDVAAILKVTTKNID